MTRRIRSVHPLASAVGIAIAVLALVASANLTGAGPSDFDRAPGYSLTTGPTLQELADKRKLLFEGSAREIPSGVLGDPIVVNLTRDEVEDLSARQLATADRGPAVVGRTKRIGSRVSFSDLDSRLINTAPRRTSVGVAQLTPDGGFVWAVAVSSENAFGMRLNIKGMNLPGDAEMYWFNMSGEAFGPYVGSGPRNDGDFWTHTISGSEGVLMVRHFGPSSASDLRQTNFTIEALAHIGPKFAGALGNSPEAFCSYNESCIENAACQNTGPAANAENAVARMQWISGAFINTCTGGLLADEAMSGTRHFLTANHCMSRKKDAGSLEAYFQYQINCGANCPAELNPGGTQVNGASVQSTSSSSDYTLLLLDGGDPLPSGTFFLGWDSAPIAFTSGAALHRISHPAWAPQAYSSHSVWTSAGQCGTIPRGDFIYSQDTFGGTEGGSSGSPVVNASGDVVGQLFGACGTNVGDACDSQNNATVDGAFAATYPNISGILGGGGGCTPTEDPEVSCTDGVDNDCDGDIDAADPDCGGGTCVNPGGAPAGASCTLNSECCNDKCKGRAGNKTCK